MQRYVLTGGPGVGKTTVIHLLKERGFTVLPEVARKVILEKGLEFRKNLEEFQKCIVEEQLAMENACVEGTAFLDRSIIDGYAYCKVGKVTPPEYIEQHARDRYTKVFLLEPLGFVEYDGVRTENKEWLGKIHAEIKDAYIHFGYEIIDVPVLSPEMRVAFILDRV